MQTRVWAAVVLAVSSATVGSGQSAAQNQPQQATMAQMHKAPVPAGPLELTFGDKSAEWTAAALAALPHTSVSVLNGHTNAKENYSGVPLIDLLAKLGVPDKPRGKQLKIYLVAAGSDGYEVVYSLTEVTPDVHDATVIVADSRDGKPLAADGPLKLVATGEKRPARWVRNLVAIKVLTAD